MIRGGRVGGCHFIEQLKNFDSNLTEKILRKTSQQKLGLFLVFNSSKIANLYFQSEKFDFID
jgi:hypothetical protein